MSMKNHIVAPLNCCGCGLCANVCSHKAIRMVWSELGFLIPRVDSSLCVNCGLCVKTCIAFEQPIPHSGTPEDVHAYGAWNKDEDTQLQSSSGGVFSAVAKQIIEKGGVVFGVAWQDKYTASFVKCDTEAALPLLRGSKYTPAFTEGVYKEVKAELLKGRQVLFSGTPCQVHALKKYLRKDYNNLLCLDIVCHGVPSRLLLEQYIREKEKLSGKNVQSISFRKKPHGWVDYHVACCYEDGSETSTSHKKDIFMDIFLSDKALNYACYNCPYSKLPRQGDITVGDYWGAQDQHLDWPLEKGISAVITNTSKGSAILDSLAEVLVTKPVDYEKMIEAQPRSFGKVTMTVFKDRPLVLSSLREMSLIEVMEKVIKTAKLGPFRIKRSGFLFKILNRLKG